MKKLVIAVILLMVLSMSTTLVAHAGYFVTSRISGNPVVHNFGAGAGSAAAGLAAVKIGAKIGGKIGAVIGGPLGIIIGAGLGAA